MITASGDVRFTGHVSGHNGPFAGITLAWELPYWGNDIERDLTPPVVANWTEFGQGTNPGISVVISDKTQAYYSGVETVELYDSPGWTQDNFFPPINRDQDATTRFCCQKRC